MGQAASPNSHGSHSKTRSTALVSSVLADDCDVSRHEVADSIPDFISDLPDECLACIFQSSSVFSLSASLWVCSLNRSSLLALLLHLSNMLIVPLLHLSDLQLAVDFLAIFCNNPF
ncbi:hypothetical protein QN277_027170 [Acacia crassicarpa]|uniref:F-box domain-containing protein n=1 Tax=Acacia crassicarpa TaxID=499986 RepID=A0AAE1MIM5_9FABA|nr:hypothetical protein QN277_027170 [Acacia crassicarpa]